MKTIFIVLCLLASGGWAIATVNRTKSSPDKGDRLYVDSDVQKMDSTDHNLFKAWWSWVPDITNGLPNNRVESWTTNQNEQHWADEQGGGGSSLNQQIFLTLDPSTSHTSLCTEQMSWPATSWEDLWQVNGTGTFTGDCSPNKDGTWSIGPPVTCSYSSFYGEHCEENDPMPPQATLFYDPHLYDSGWEYTEEDQTYTRHAQTKLKLQPGGLAVPHRMNLFQISGEAEGILDKRAVPPYTHTTMQEIPPQNMQIGKLGKLGADGNLWVALPAGGKSIDVTPHVSKPFYIFGATETKVIPDVQLAVDRNHDQQISFGDDDQTSPANPFRFWVNDVNYDGDIISGGDVPGSGHNGSSGQVNGRVDVINFFPVAVRIGTPNVMPPDLFQYRLNGKGLYYTYTDVTPDHALDYLTTDATTSARYGYGPELQFSVDSAQTIRANGKTTFNTTFTNMMYHHNGQGVVLMTASSKLTPDTPLELRVYWHNQWIYSTNLYLSISGVEDMYRHKNLNSVASGGHNEVPDRTTAPNWPDDMTNDKYFVFLHGYNVNQQQARGYAAEMFKRLWWSGSNAKLYAVSWYGYDTQVLGSYTYNYHCNAIHAFETAPALADFLYSLPGQTVVAGHSLGNMVVSAAITTDGGTAAKFFMIDGAVATEAFVPDQAKEPGMMNNHWDDYYLDGAGECLYASEWYKLFDASDPRNQLTWRGVFANWGQTPVYNYFSSGEDVLDNIPHDEGNLTDVASYAWGCQEKLKGRTWVNFVGSTVAGWGFNTDDYTPTVEQAQNLIANTSQLITMPFFKKSPGDLFSTDAVTAQDYAYQHYYELLAKAIPARTYAAGRNPVPGLNPHDMQTEMETGWPSSRDNNHWLLSDFKNVAYPFNHTLFENITRDGGLQ
jgi:hypothetical protein